MAKQRVYLILASIALGCFFSATPILNAQELPACSAGVSDCNSSRTGEGQGTAAQSEERIVDGRPPLYIFKRNINPLTWMGVGFQSIGQSLDQGALKRFVSPPPEKPPFWNASLAGMGIGTGFGPQITLSRKFGAERKIDIDLPFLVTYKFYQLYQAHAGIPLGPLSDPDRYRLHFTADYASRASDLFFGLGNESDVHNRSAYRVVSREAMVDLTAQRNANWTVDTGVSYRDMGVTKPHNRVSALNNFQNDNVPGMFTGANIGSAFISLEHSTKDNKAMGASGGSQRIQASLNEGFGKGDFSYWKYNVELQQFIPLTSDHRKVIALRAIAVTNQEKGNSQVPFMDMAILGDQDTLRGFDNYRFYDKSALDLTVEYRYRIWQAMDWGLFVDAGQVAPEPGDFALNQFHKGYGVRLFMKPKPDRPIVIDIARSAEGLRFYINFKPTF